MRHMGAVGIKRREASYMTSGAHGQHGFSLNAYGREAILRGKTWDERRKHMHILEEEELKRPEDNDSVGKVEAPSS